jgi:small subunit ribosomal protein S8
MNQTDPIADMLTRIRNANMIRADIVEMPHSKVKGTIARILKREGFIHDFTAEGGGHRKLLRLFLKYAESGEPVIRGLHRISKPGLRRYVAAKAIRPIKNGTGIAIISTSLGIFTDSEVREKNAGGEWLCTVW